MIGPPKFPAGPPRNPQRDVISLVFFTCSLIFKFLLRAFAFIATSHLPL